MAASRTESAKAVHQGVSGVGAPAFPVSVPVGPPSDAEASSAGRGGESPSARGPAARASET
jgi:hypothetical protein